ncbi:Haem-binding domain-containing protein [Mariniphaga anaerophila]|uniref:Haem-binding domain-containing protein n=2 Tax=Mariniphaga anaerophila TaxID=1484053 RepID=A0A1M4XYA9_9BACT|nr:Haem-binding domain-containing protein [Mariniphaga anaerophila]
MISKSHIFEKEQIQEEVKSILENACLDCHSNQTNYLWYHNISPVSWMVKNHISEGKSELNLSEWGKWKPLDQLSALDKMTEEIKNGEMPLKSYTFMHTKAKLTAEQKEQFYSWAEQLSEQLLVKMTNE